MRIRYFVTLTADKQGRAPTMILGTGVVESVSELRKVFRDYLTRYNVKGRPVCGWRKLLAHKNSERVTVERITGTTIFVEWFVED